MSIQFPQIGQIYLVQRKRNGPAALRYQLAEITNVRSSADVSVRVDEIDVTWLYDGVHQAHIGIEQAKLKLPTKAWLRAEDRRLKAEKLFVDQARFAVAKFANSIS